MSVDWYPGIRAACNHWRHAPMLQQTFETLEREFENGSDASIDAAKAIVECICRVIIDELDDPIAPKKPPGNDVPIHNLVGLSTRLLKLGEVRHRKFADLIKYHNKHTNSLRELRNEAGTVSHGKDGFIAKLTDHHRRAAVLSADAIVTFLHEAYLELEPVPATTMEPYERFERMNLLIDAHCGFKASEYDDGFLNVTVQLPGGDEIPLAIEISRLLFGVDREAYKSALTFAREAATEEFLEVTENLFETVFEIDSKKLGITAQAQEIDDQFIVLKGSFAVSAWRQAKSASSGYGKLHQKLVDDGKLVPQGDGHLARFSENVPFASPSAASAVIYGRSDNGRKSWRVQGQNMTYADWQKQQFAQTPSDVGGSEQEQPDLTDAENAE